MGPVGVRLRVDGQFELRAGRYVWSANGLPLGDWVARKFLDG